MLLFTGTGWRLCTVMLLCRNSNSRFVFVPPPLLNFLTTQSLGIHISDVFWRKVSHPAESRKLALLFAEQELEGMLARHATRTCPFDASSTTHHIPQSCMFDTLLNPVSNVLFNVVTTETHLSYHCVVHMAITVQRACYCLVHAQAEKGLRWHSPHYIQHVWEMCDSFEEHRTICRNSFREGSLDLATQHC